MATTGKKLMRLQRQVESAEQAYRWALNAANKAKAAFTSDPAVGEYRIALVSAEHEMNQTEQELREAREALEAAQ